MTLLSQVGLGSSIFDPVSSMTEPLLHPNFRKWQAISKILTILAVSGMGLRTTYLEIKINSLDTELGTLKSLYNSIEENKPLIEKYRIAIEATDKYLKEEGVGKETIESIQEFCQSASRLSENTVCQQSMESIQLAIASKKKIEETLNNAKKTLAEIQKDLDEDEKQFREIMQNLNE